MTAERARIFVSYRRVDRAYAGRLIDDLRDYYGRERVFRDIDSNRPGQDYVQQIALTIEHAELVIAVVGPNWAHLRDANDDHRLSQPSDPVRQELEQSAQHGIPVIPVLVADAAMPGAEELPESLQWFATNHASKLSDDDWAYHLRRLLEVVEGHGVRPRRVVAPESDAQVAPVDEPPAVTRYERVIKGSRNGVYRGVIATVHSLGYEVIEELGDATQVTFKPRSPAARETTTKVVDDSPGHAKVVVEVVKINTAGLAAAAGAAAYMTAGVGLLAWPAVRRWERNYAAGFLDNVQAVFEGRGIGKDSALLPGVTEWRKRSKRV